MAGRKRGADSRRRRWRAFASDVLVAQKKFSDGKWKDYFVRLREDIEAFRHVLENLGSEPLAASDPDPRELFVWAWCVLIAAPDRYAQFYLRIPETGENSLRSLSLALRERRYGMDGLATAQRKCMEWLGALVRAIDEDLAGIEGLPGGTEGWSAGQWMPEGYPCFVIPVERPFRAQGAKDRARRATVHHAIVPSELGALTVELILLPDLPEKEPGNSWHYGAAIFDGLTLDIESRSPDGFIVADAPVPQAEMTISGHVGSALAAGCDVLVWPELTIPDARLVALRARLGADPLADPRRVPISVAGSRHIELAEGHWVNRTDVFAGKGQHLASYDKRKIFFEGEGPFEDIVSGEKLLVLVAEDRLISVAICKDFCDDIDNEIYSRLCVDLVLVPSLGGTSTLEAHKRSAKSTQSKQGSVTFMVQQRGVQTGVPDATGKPPGYSFVNPSNGIDQPPDCSQNTSFRLLAGRR